MPKASQTSLAEKAALVTRGDFSTVTSATLKDAAAEVSDRSISCRRHCCKIMWFCSLSSFYIRKRFLPPFLVLYKSSMAQSHFCMVAASLSGIMSLNSGSGLFSRKDSGWKGVDYHWCCCSLPANSSSNLQVCQGNLPLCALQPRCSAHSSVLLWFHGLLIQLLRASVTLFC